MGVAEALLGLLSRGPAHGYQLRTDFETVTGDAWPLNVGQVYTTLQRLERDGLVVVGGQDGDRIVHRLTEAGHEAAEAWLSAPPDATGRDRDETTMRVLLALARDPAEALAVIDAQRDALTAELQRITKARAAPADGDLATTLQHDRIALECRARIDWLELAEERIRHDIERGRA